jgi:type II secretory pathway component PulF
MNRQTTNPSVAANVLLLAVAALLWATVLAVLALAVPRYERAFRDKNAQLPDVTLGVLAAGRWSDNYWYVVPLFGLLMLPFIVLLTWLLRHRTAERWPGWLWFGLLLGVPVLLQLVIWSALLRT